MTLPLLARWRIRADELPDRLLDMDRPAAAFTLPGASALSGFADLIGGAQEDASPSTPIIEEEEDAPFPLPALLPDDVPGEASLSLEIDFGALSGDRAVLAFDEILGCGEILLGDQMVAAFGRTSAADMAAHASGLAAAPCALAVDLTDALRLGRRETLTIHFDASRPAGIPGPVFLRLASGGYLSHAVITPSAASRTMAVRARIHAIPEGRYMLRVQPLPAALDAAPLPAREITCSLNPLETRACTLSLAVPGELFAAGQPYSLPALRLELLYMTGSAPVLCDQALLACGYPGAPAPCFLPLAAGDLSGGTDALLDRLAALHVQGVSLPAPASDSLYLALSRSGVSVRHALPADHPPCIRMLRFPCVTIDALRAASPRFPASQEEAAWQLCGVTGMARIADPDMTPADLLHDAAGRALNPADEGVRAVLGWLSAVAVRLRAEAARQQRYTGALCAPGEWDQPDVADAIACALAPLHLSALPLLGAWWTGTRFSAALEAFVPDDLQHSLLTARAVLEDDEGSELARIDRPFVPRTQGRGAPVGVIEATLPDTPCVLTLTTSLYHGDALLEESSLPVYVGLRGPLEAAF